MGWLAAALFTAIAVAMYVARGSLARGQALIFGGRIGPGFVIAEAIVFLVLAVLAVVFRDLLR
ncbi:MAG TPA: hypothetical protein VEO54_30590 [Thermoanaerobaculia bacterium]|nr:hypothetical protein [Thermoanaerobaculia bacterium]